MGWCVDRPGLRSIVLDYVFEVNLGYFEALAQVVAEEDIALNACKLAMLFASGKGASGVTFIKILADGRCTKLCFEPRGGFELTEPEPTSSGLEPGVFFGFCAQGVTEDEHDCLSRAWALFARHASCGVRLKIALLQTGIEDLVKPFPQAQLILRETVQTHSGLIVSLWSREQERQASENNQDVILKVFFLKNGVPEKAISEFEEINSIVECIHR